MNDIDLYAYLDPRGWGDYLYGVSVPPSTVPPNYPPVVAAGTSSLSFSSGAATLTFPEPFPSALCAVIVTPAASSGNFFTLSIDLETAQLTGVTVYANSGEDPYTGTLSVCWVA